MLRYSKPAVSRGNETRTVGPQDSHVRQSSSQDAHKKRSSLCRTIQRSSQNWNVQNGSVARSPEDTEGHHTAPSPTETTSSNMVPQSHQFSDSLLHSHSHAHSLRCSHREFLQGSSIAHATVLLRCCQLSNPRRPGFSAI